MKVVVFFAAVFVLAFSFADPVSAQEPGCVFQLSG